VRTHAVVAAEARNLLANNRSGLRDAAVNLITGEEKKEVAKLLNEVMGLVRSGIVGFIKSVTQNRTPIGLVGHGPGLQL
jgi:hypothetical protein